MFYVLIVKLVAISHKVLHYIYKSLITDLLDYIGVLGLYKVNSS